MLNNKNIFYKKKILIYGLGKSGLSAYKFLKKKNTIYLYDDRKINNKSTEIKKNLITYKNLLKKKIDYIIISPGINIQKCELSKFIKKNLEKINTDLDIFYNKYSENINITITGTNGKSTTAKILYEILRNNKKDVRLVGNIGNPILLEKNITNNTIFVIEASSYQLEYSMYFKSNVAVILNISPDHLERHKTFKNYVRAKFKLIKNQSRKDYAILDTSNFYVKQQLRTQKFLSKIIKVKKKVDPSILKKIDNPYFRTDGNKENLSFIIEIIKIFNINKKNIFKTLRNFNGLKYRQQIIFRSNNLTVINDSKATTFSSSASILKSLTNVHWLIGGLAKKGDKFSLSKNKCKNFKAYIFGKNNKFFTKELKNIIKYESFKDLKSSVNQIFLNMKNNNNKKHQTILFSPASASFDSFKNFEDRGKYFNKIIEKFINVR
jgi:UDP-N-acetylmuramoylalanine--D-glutamate ligase